MTTEEFAKCVEDINKLTPMPGDFIIVRLKHVNFTAEKFDKVKAQLAVAFGPDQRILIVDDKVELSTYFGRCLKCGTDINPESPFHG